MNETVSLMSAMLAGAYIGLILLAGSSALSCYLKRQLVKANFYLSASAFGFMALMVLIALVDSCSAE